MMTRSSNLRSRPDLPIDAVLDDVKAAVRATGSVVIVAPPGAGKTTRVPQALLEVFDTGRILVLEPRRLAARLAAEYTASECGGAVGDQVGYSVRFDERCGPQTRVVFMTTGVLLRMLPSDPQLRGVACVVFDEFHERHLADDAVLAHVAALPVAKVVMSATLNPKPVAGLLDDAPVVHSEGRRFPVDISYLKRPDSRQLPVMVAAALRNAPPDGDVLVFLPSVRAIERCTSACADIAAATGLELIALHASLGPDAIRQALKPRDARKVLLATNIAESSVTFDGVRGVIDSGLHKLAQSSPWTGLSTLAEVPIPRDSADQRAGRAGRTAPGWCARLYTEADYRGRDASTLPEVRRVDFAPIVLMLLAMGLQPDKMRWLDAPEDARLRSALDLLRGLGAITPDDALTPLGRRMLRLPLHPRLARLVLSCDEQGAPRMGRLAAALISEGVRLPDGAADTDNDVLTLIDAFDRRRLGGIGRRVAAVAKQLKTPRGSGWTADEADALASGLLAAFSDRVARGSGPQQRFVDLIGGARARLGPACGVRDHKWLVVVNAGGGAQPVVRLACAIDPEQLLELPDADEALTEAIEVRWDSDRERVTAERILRFRGLPLESSAIDARGVPEATELLRKQVRTAGLARFTDAKALALHRDRRHVAHAEDASLPDLDDDAIRATLDRLCEGCVSFKELKAADLLATVQAQLTWPQRQRMEKLAPLRITLPSGQWVKVKYVHNGPPRVSARVQFFLGLADGPRLGGKPVLLELLAPNQRPVQLTDDLAGFWKRTWPQVRKELRGRYPKHDWPEDPTR